MPNYVAIGNRWYYLSDDPTNASIEATAVIALAGSIVTGSQVKTTVNNTDTTVDPAGTMSIQI